MELGQVGLSLKSVRILFWDVLPAPRPGGGGGVDAWVQNFLGLVLFLAANMLCGLFDFPLMLDFLLSSPIVSIK